MASVELRALTKRYGEVAVVDDVSLTIEHGRLVCLLGPSGCGKTTTLRLIAGFVEPSAGEIHVGERLVSSPARTVPPERRNMSMIFQSYALWPHMTVAENVAYGLNLRKIDRETIARKLQSILSTTHLEQLAERYPGELSGGQQQRVALARAWALEPQLLLLDEPTASLDPHAKREVEALLGQISRDAAQAEAMTLVFASHNLGQVKRLASRVIYMEHGRLVADLPVHDFFNGPLPEAARLFVKGELV